ncbi:MAG: hypothetical protein ACYTG0_12505 [Planctomycetota bacterium]|jgi:hypothetical protein
MNDPKQMTVTQRVDSALTRPLPWHLVPEELRVWLVLNLHSQCRGLLSNSVTERVMYEANAPPPDPTRIPLVGQSNRPESPAALMLERQAQTIVAACFLMAQATEGPLFTRGALHAAFQAAIAAASDNNPIYQNAVQTTIESVCKALGISPPQPQAPQLVPTEPPSEDGPN